jgi:cytochrome c peroxidase
MRHLEWWARAGAVAAMCLWVSGCEPAGRPKRQIPRAQATLPRDKIASPGTEPPKPAEPPLNAGLTWLPPTESRQEPLVLMEFVQADIDPKQWNELKQFWTVVPHSPAAAVGVPPLQAAVLALAPTTVKIKVPLGLDDPTPHIPLANPPTAGKWELGKKLFFDDGWLYDPAAGKFACATCHDPQQGFTCRTPPVGLPPFRFNTPTLYNTAYNNYQFWDGRAGALEEVVQRSLQDERPDPNNEDRHHTWTGVVQRLRDDSVYRDQFARVFGTRPTQDAVGKALATYMRTILKGDSIYDRAFQSMRQRKGNDLEPADFEKFLDDATLKAWEREQAMKADVAKELHAGYQLFFGKASCFKCHGGANFTDNSFHNLGVGNPGFTPDPGKETGRFAVLPIGLKNPAMIGAFKTPTLRGLSKTGPYFHDGLRGFNQTLYENLYEVAAFHVKGGIWNRYLDEELRDPKDPKIPRDLGLKNDEVHALALFLQALEGQPVAAIVREAPKPDSPIPSQP